jgi:uncharacterized protein YbjT (DUF2867 family)
VKVILFGSTGMVGQGVLGECLRAPDVTEVIAVVRSASGVTHPKLREIVHRDFTDFTGLHVDADACFWCLGITSVGTSEADYARVTRDFTVAAAKALARPTMTVVFVSGQGADGTAMWARVKKSAEDALFAMPFKAVYVFRPGMIQPKDGIRSRTRIYNLLYPVLLPFLLIWKSLSPGSVTDTRRVGQAMLNVTRHGFPKRILSNTDINAAASASA